MLVRLIGLLVGHVCSFELTRYVFIYCFNICSKELSDSRKLKKNYIFPFFLLVFSSQ
jgi:hypothetical protein